MSNDIGYSKWEPAPKQATQYQESVCLARPLPHPCLHDHHHEPITVPSHPRRQTGTRAASVCDMLAAWVHVSQTRSSSGATKLGGPGGQAGKVGLPRPDRVRQSIASPGQVAENETEETKQVETCKFFVNKLTDKEGYLLPWAQACRIPVRSGN